VSHPPPSAKLTPPVETLAASRNLLKSGDKLIIPRSLREEKVVIKALSRTIPPLALKSGQIRI